MFRRIHSPRRRWFRELRPIKILFPAVFAQIALFAIVMIKPADNFFELLATGNLMIIALAVLPGIWSHPAPRAHWIR